MATASSSFPRSASRRSPSTPARRPSTTSAAAGRCTKSSAGPSTTPSRSRTTSPSRSTRRTGPGGDVVRVAFLGLGDIGMPMAVQLLRSGFEVVGLDTSADRVDRLRAEGGDGASDVDHLGDCEVVCLAVPDDPAVESLVLDERLSTRSVLVHSTILPSTAQRLDEALAPRGVAVHDAPVSGGAARARTGELTIMVGGEPGEQSRQVLDALGSTVLCGPVGSGAAVKLANQLSMLASLAALHEGLAIAEHYGAEESLVLDVLRSSTGASWSAANWGFFDDLAATYDSSGTPVHFRPWSKDLWD